MVDDSHGRRAPRPRSRRARARAGWLLVLAAGVAGCGDASAAPLPEWTGPLPTIEAEPAAPVAAAPRPANAAAPEPEPEQAGVSVASLVLGDLDVEADVTEVGVSSDRVLEVPEDPRILGRWSDGARPGDGSGSVVLVGHVDYRGLPGALHDLADLDVGAEAVVVGADGSEARYVVEQVDTYEKQVLPYEDIFRFDVPERLVLITCGGEIDPTSGHYDSNVVAYLARV